jgi:hypothetical protein
MFGLNSLLRAAEKKVLKPFVREGFNHEFIVTLQVSYCQFFSECTKPENSVWPGIRASPGTVKGNPSRRRRFLLPSSFSPLHFGDKMGHLRPFLGPRFVILIEFSTYWLYPTRFHPVRPNRQELSAPTSRTHYWVLGKYR